MSFEAVDFSSLVWVQIWQIGVLGILVGVANLSIARRWPHLAYALWLVVLVKCFVPPLGYSPANLLGWATPTALWSSSSESHSRLVTADKNSAATNATSRSNDNFREERIKLQAGAVANQKTAFAGAPAMATGGPIGMIQLLAVGWLSGSVLLCGIAIGRSSLVSQRLRRSALPICDELLPLIAEISKRIGLRRPVRVLQTATNIGPIAIGVLQPTIYLPEFLLNRMPQKQLEAMLAHELAHVRRRDTWVAAAQFVAQTIWWFHPLVWWMNYRITRERERCCDEEVIVSLRGRRADYARLLVTVLEANHELEPLWLCPAVRSAELTRNRLEEIMKRKNMAYARSPRWSWAIAAILALAVVPNSGWSAAEDAQDTAAQVGVAQNAQNAKATASSAKRATSSARSPVLLSYGDGKADGKKSYGGSGHMIRFEMPEGVTKVRGLRIHGSRYGVAQAPDEDFEITFLSEDRQETLDTQTAPYRLFKRGKENWVRVLFDKEVELPKTFWLALNFNPHQTKGVYLSYDTSTKGKHSRVGLVGDDEEPKETDFAGDWMVQVMLSRPAP